MSSGLSPPHPHPPPPHLLASQSSASLMHGGQGLAHASARRSKRSAQQGGSQSSVNKSHCNKSHCKSHIATSHIATSQSDEEDARGTGIEDSGMYGRRTQGTGRKQTGWQAVQQDGQSRALTGGLVGYAMLQGRLWSSSSSRQGPNRE